MLVLPYGTGNKVSRNDDGLSAVSYKIVQYIFQAVEAAREFNINPVNCS